MDTSVPTRKAGPLRCALCRNAADPSHLTLQVLDTSELAEVLADPIAVLPDPIVCMEIEGFWKEPVGATGSATIGASRGAQGISKQYVERQTKLHLLSLIILMQELAQMIFARLDLLPQVFVKCLSALSFSNCTAWGRSGVTAVQRSPTAL